MQTKLFTLVLLSFATAALSEDFKTVNGKEYKDATVTRVDPDGIAVKTKSGIAKVYFTELPKDVQEHFITIRKRRRRILPNRRRITPHIKSNRTKRRRQQQAADAKIEASVAAQQAATNRMQALQTRYGELQKQEDGLLRQIGQAKQLGPRTIGKSVRHQPNPLKSELPVLQSHLSDVRHEKTEVKKQLEKAQH